MRHGSRRAAARIGRVVPIACLRGGGRRPSPSGFGPDGIAAVMARTLSLPGRRLPIRALPPGRFGRRSRSVLRMRRTRMARRLLPVRHGYALALGRGRVLRVAAAVRAARQAIE
ncbi:hypothetical protein L665_04643 [Ralstonia solanacearum SD54]|nr:hypothetical protein L665_04643 [Ralstonia solanacearum SD54]